MKTITIMTYATPEDVQNSLDSFGTHSLPKLTARLIASVEVERCAHAFLGFGDETELSIVQIDIPDDNKAKRVFSVLSEDFDSSMIFMGQVTRGEDTQT